MNCKKPKRKKKCTDLIHLSKSGEARQGKSLVFFRSHSAPSWRSEAECVQRGTMVAICVPISGFGRLPDGLRSKRIREEKADRILRCPPIRLFGHTPLNLFIFSRLTLRRFADRDYDGSQVGDLSAFSTS